MLTRKSNDAILCNHSKDHYFNNTRSILNADRFVIKPYSRIRVFVLVNFDSMR